MEFLVVIETGHLLILSLALLMFILPIIAVIDIIKSEFNGNDKIIFVLIVLFFPILGSIIYFTIGTSKKIGKR